MPSPLPSIVNERAVRVSLSRNEPVALASVFTFGTTASPVRVALKLTGSLSFGGFDGSSWPRTSPFGLAGVAI